MTEFERELVKAFNRYFAGNDLQGIAYRRKQHRFSSQFLDVLVDSPHQQYYLGIENKSVKTSSSNKLYFSQHFSENDDGHQIDRISDFLQRSGRRGYLAVELKRGRGKPRRAFLVPWDSLERRWNEGHVGIPLEDLERFYEIDRNAEDYDLAGLFGGPA